MNENGYPLGNLANLRYLLIPTEPRIALVDRYVRVRIGLYENAFPTGLLYSELEELDFE